MALVVAGGRLVLVRPGAAEAGDRGGEGATSEPARRRDRAKVAGAMGEVAGMRGEVLTGTSGELHYGA